MFLFEKISSKPGDVLSFWIEKVSDQSTSYSLVSKKNCAIARHDRGLRAQSRKLVGRCSKRHRQGLEGDGDAELILFQRGVLLETLD